MKLAKKLLSILIIATLIFTIIPLEPAFAVTKRVTVTNLCHQSAFPEILYGPESVYGKTFQMDSGHIFYWSLYWGRSNTTENFPQPLHVLINGSLVNRLFEGSNLGGNHRNSGRYVGTGVPTEWRFGFNYPYGRQPTSLHPLMMCVVDLTATFGAGNEPDDAWCEANLQTDFQTKDVDYNMPDRTPPSIQSINVEGGWKAGNKNVTINAIDAETGINGYAIENITGWQPGNTFVLPNGTYTALTRNGENLVARQSFTVSGVDTAAPSASISGNPTSWVNTDVTLTIAATDNGVGLASEPYSFDSGSTWQAAPSKIYTANTDNIVISVKDKLGNAARLAPVSITKIDKDAPAASISGNPTSWVNTDVTLTIAATDIGAGLASEPYSFDGGSTWQAATTKMFATNSLSVSISIKDKMNNLYNMPTFDISFIDKEKPVVNAVNFIKREEKLAKSILTMFNRQVDIELIAHDIGGSDISKIEYQLVPNGSTEDAAGWLVYDNAARPIIERRFSGKIHARCVDGAGNVSDVLTSEVVVEDTPPTATHSLNTESWTNSDITILIAAQDDLSGVHHIVLPNGQEISAAAADYIVADNGTYAFSVFDNSGNEFKYPVVVSNIDKTSPIVTPNVPTAWQQEITFTLDSFDNQSGTVEYQVAADTNIPKTWQSTNSFTTQKNGIIYGFAKDAVGNISQPVAIDIQNIDREKPVADKIIITKTSSSLMRSMLSFFNKQAEIELIAHDIGGSDISKIEYQLVPEGSTEDAAAWLVYDNAARPIIERRFNGKIHARCIDGAGNVSDVLTSDVIVEDTPPTATHSLNTESWANSDVTISIAAQDDLSGVHHIVLPNGQEVSAAAAEYVVAHNGTYAFSVFDNSGNEFKYPVVVSNIDKTAPIVTPNVPTAWQQEITFTLDSFDNQSGTVAYQVTPDTNIPTTWQTTNSFTTQKNGIIYGFAKDAVGNISQPVAIDIQNTDREKPVVDKIVFTKTNSDLLRSVFSFLGKQAKIELTAHDVGSAGVFTIEYQLVPNGSTEDAAGWLVYNNAARPIIERRFTGKVHARCVDGAGNVSDVLTSEVIVEDTPPTATHKLNTENWTNSDVTISIAAQDDLSGVHHIVLPNGQEVSVVTADYTVAYNGTYTFSVFDNSGNEFKYPVAVSNIDKQPPTQPMVNIPKKAMFQHGRAIFPWANKATDISLDSNAASGISSYEYRSSPKENWQPVNGKSLIVKSEGINNIAVRAISVAGNVSIPSDIVVRNDYSSPTATLSLINDETINLVSEDNLSGIATVFLPDGSLIDVEKYNQAATESENNTQNSNIDYHVSSPGDYKFTVIDKAGNEKIAEISVPHIDVAPLEPPAETTNGKTPKANTATDKPENISNILTKKTIVIATTVGGGFVGIFFFLFTSFSNAIIYDENGKRLGVGYIKKGNLSLNKIKHIRGNYINVFIKKSYVCKHLSAAVCIFYDGEPAALIPLGEEPQEISITISIK